MSHPIDDPDWQREYFRRRRVDEARIPERYRRRTLDSFVALTPAQRKMLGRMRDYLATVDQTDGLESPNGLLLYGPRGTGKTHLLSAVLMELIARGRRGLFLSPIDWFTHIRSTFGRSELGEETEQDMLDEAISADALLIDDLGIGKGGKEWEAEKVYQLIQGRCGMGKITLITSNPAFPDELALHVGERVTSRLFELCRVYNTASWPDWRESNQKKTTPREEGKTGPATGKSPHRRSSPACRTASLPS